MTINIQTTTVQHNAVIFRGCTSYSMYTERKRNTVHNIFQNAGLLPTQTRYMLDVDSTGLQLVYQGKHSDVEI